MVNQSVSTSSAAAGQNLRIRHQRDFWSGSLFTLAGVGFAVLSGEYHIGATARMGPGFFPLCLGILLAIFGLVVLLSSLSPTAEQTRLPYWQPGKLVLVLGSCALFSLLLEPAGLVISLLVLVFTSSRASRQGRLTGTLINAAVLIALTLSLFIWGLELTIPVWPDFITH